MNHAFVRDLRHWWRKHHWPEWVEMWGLLACVRCARGGHRMRVMQVHLVAHPLH